MIIYSTIVNLIQCAVQCSGVSLGENLLAVVEVEMPLEVAHHLVTVRTLLLQRFAKVNSLHVQPQVAPAVRLVVALVTPVVQHLLVYRVNMFVEELLPLELFLTNPALETLPTPLVFRTVALSVLEVSPQVLGPLATVGTGPDVLLTVDTSDVSVQRPLARRGVAAVRARKRLVAQRTGLDVRGEILVELAAVRTHSLVTLHEARARFLPGLRLRLLGLVLVGVVVPDVAAERVVGLEQFLAVRTDVGQVLVELLEVSVQLAAADTDLPVVLLPLVPLKHLRLEEDFAALRAGVLRAPLLAVILDNAPGVERDPGGVVRGDVLHQLLPGLVPLLTQPAPQALLPLLALQLLPRPVGVEVAEV